MGTPVDEIRDVFREAGARGWLYARRVDADPADPAVEVDVGAGDPVVLASVFKVPFALAYSREVAAGRLEARETTTVTARDRTGGTGTAGCADDVTLSWRDLAMLMLTVSDNAAADVLYRRLGPDSVQAVLDDVGMYDTRIIGCCEDLFITMAEDLGVTLDDLGQALGEATDEQTWKLSVLDPVRTSATTPRDIAALLTGIWMDTAADPDACADVRSMMAHQVWPHRLTAGFPDGVRIAAKTGTLPAIRNEAGVVTYPDGEQYVVAVFTRADTLAQRQPRIDAAIGETARMAVEHLRGDQW